MSYCRPKLPLLVLTAACVTGCSQWYNGGIGIKDRQAVAEYQRFKQEQQEKLAAGCANGTAPGAPAATAQSDAALALRKRDAVTAAAFPVSPRGDAPGFSTAGETVPTAAGPVDVSTSLPAQAQQVSYTPSATPPAPAPATVVPAAPAFTNPAPATQAQPAAPASTRHPAQVTNLQH